VENALTKFSPVKLMDEIQLNDDLKVKFLPVGHILGAASVLINLDGKNILFSGDIGRVEQSIIKSFKEFNFENISPDYIIMESLYGGKIHENKDENISVLKECIQKINKSKGKLLIPVFAMHRAQEILEIMNFLVKSQTISNEFEIYLDSPMAIEISKIYLNNLNEFNDNATYLNNKVNFVYGRNNPSDRNNEFSINQEDRFIPENLKTILKQKKSKKLINATNAVIMAGSGMADGGRIVKHLYNGLERSENIVLLVGFQAEETLGRKLAEGEKKITIMDKDINVRAEIKYLRGFSAHADENELIIWLKKFNNTKLKKIFLVHAEEESLEIFSKKLIELNIENSTPSYCDTVDIQ
jgi:metallo-beta-lactamase family protein